MNPVNITDRMNFLYDQLHKIDSTYVKEGSTSYYLSYRIRKKLNPRVHIDIYAEQKNGYGTWKVHIDTSNYKHFVKRNWTFEKTFDLAGKIQEKVKELSALVLEDDRVEQARLAEIQRKKDILTSKFKEYNPHDVETWRLSVFASRYSKKQVDLRYNEEKDTFSIESTPHIPIEKLKRILDILADK